MSEPILEANNITKYYQQGGERLDILKGIDLSIYEGDLISIQGHSGAGKSTLLHILGTLDLPSGGSLAFGKQNLLDLNDEELSLFRNRSMGFVFQAHHLLPEFTAIENVMLPALIAGQGRKTAKELAKKILIDVGLEHRMTHYPSELSGGERQRVSIGRAIIRKPAILFADEPTGNLDTNTSAMIQELLFDLHKKYNVALIIVTHEMSYAKKFPKALRMENGHWLS